MVLEYVERKSFDFIFVMILAKEDGRAVILKISIVLIVRSRML